MDGKEESDPCLNVISSVLKRLEKSLYRIEESQKAAEIFRNKNPYSVFQKFELCFEVCLEHYVVDDKYSYIAFQAILPVLECFIKLSVKEPVYFAHLVQISGHETMIKLLTECVPRLIDAEMLFGVDTIDLLLCTLALYSVATGKHMLAQFIDAVPYFNGFYLRKHMKRFEELFTYIHSNQTVTYNADTKKNHIVLEPHYLTCMHYASRKIIVSNAPPVKLRKSSIARRDKFSCEISAGGLVSGIKPSLGLADIWVSYLDPSLIGLDRMPSDMASKIFKESIRIPSKYRRSPSLHSRHDSLSSDEQDTDTYSKLQDFLWEKTENDFLGLQKRLDAFAERNFQINPLVILKDDHKAFYNGISNGLFWPAFHNLCQYIIEDYKGDENKASKLADDWIKYVKVNFHFATHAARSCRSQDFLWIHDYHLFIVGQMLRYLDPELQCGFFLHIPFNLTHEFVAEYKTQALAVLRGLLGFKQVGFQTSRDCDNFVQLVHKYIPEAQVEKKRYWRNNVGYIVQWGDWSTDIGTFPISVKIETILEIANAEETAKRAQKMKKRIMCLCTKPNGCLFLSVERFDYTKGIVERLAAIDHYFQAHPERLGQDVFYQIAASSRSDVSAYKAYQRQVFERADAINEQCFEILKNEDSGLKNHEWKPIVIDTLNHPQNEVIELYKASCIIVATPVADGMNLVIKEAILSNPAAVYVLSTGAGAERQFYDAGLSKHYFRISDITDAEYMAECFYKATQMESQQIMENGRILADFVQQHDIGHWISSYVDPQWTHNVIQRKPCETLEDLEQLMYELQGKRKQAVQNLHDVTHIGEDYDLSLRNVLHEVQSMLRSSSTFIELMDKKGVVHHINALSLIRGLQLDLGFLDTFKRGGGNLTSYVENFINTSTIDEEEFCAEFQLVKLFLQRIHDIHALVLCYEDILVSPSVSPIQHPDKIIHRFELLQTITCGLLVTHFGGKIATETQIISSQPEQIIRNLCLVEPGSVCLHSNESFQSHENETSFKGKRILMCCNPERNASIIGWVKTIAQKVYVLPVQLDAVPEKDDDVVLPSQPGSISTPEVFFAAMAARICKPLDITRAQIRKP